jgi:hypothetical protein
VSAVSSYVENLTTEEDHLNLGNRKTYLTWYGLDKARRHEKHTAVFLAEYRYDIPVSGGSTIGRGSSYRSKVARSIVIDSL